MQVFDLIAVFPELLLLLGACFLLIASVFVREKPIVVSNNSASIDEPDIFHTPRGVGFVYFFSLILLAVLAIAFVGRVGDE